MGRALLALQQGAVDAGVSVGVVTRSAGSLRLELWLPAVLPPEGGSARARVLCVTGNDAVAREVVALLAELGFAVTLARDAADALRLVERGSIDVVLVDEGSSELPALTLARQMVRLDPRLPIVLASASACEIEEEPGLRIVRADKPYAAETLDAALRSALAPRSAGWTAGEPERR